LPALIALTILVHALSLAIWFDDETVRFFVLDRPGLWNFPQALWGNWIELTEHDGTAWRTIEVASQTWRPLMTLSFLVDRALWGRWAPGYHLLNLLGHLVVVLLVRALVLEVSGRADVAWLAAALFAVHPLSTQPMWILGDRAEVFSAGFVVAAILLGVRARRRPWRARTWSLVLLLVLGGLASKEMAITFPLIFLCTDLAARTGSVRAWLRRQLGVRGLLELGSIGALLLGYLAYRAWIFGGMGGYHTLSHSNVSWVLPVLARDLEWMTVWDLAVPGWFGRALVVVLLLHLVWAPRPRLQRWAALWILITLAPVHNLCQKWYLYSPLIGWSALVAGWLCPRLAGGWTWMRRAVAGLCVLALAVTAEQELIRRYRNAAVGPRIARQIRKWTPVMPPGSTVVLMLPGDLEERDLDGYFFRAEGFRVQSNPSPLDGVVEDLNQTRLWRGRPVYSKLVQSALRLAYGRSDLVTRLESGRFDLSGVDRTTTFVYQFNPRTLRLRPR
jgi:hypothetical protein